MTEEAQDMNTKTDEATEVLTSESPKSPNTKSAEKKLKEMSRKAKERGKSNTPKPRSEPVIKFNQNWFLGGLGLSAIIALGYFIYKSRGSISERQHEATRPPPELQPYHHPTHEDETKKDANVFDLNSF